MNFPVDRPPHVIAFVADMGGCGNHRILSPMSALLAAGLITGTVSGALPSVEHLALTAPDIIVCQRFVERAQIDFLRQVREQLPNVFIVYEVDDILSSVPDESWHKPFMPLEIDNRIIEALPYCHAVSTTTEAMAVWLRGLGATDVRVVPNLLPLMFVRERAIKGEGKPRIGFFGGISHGGDVQVLYKAMKATADRAQWVFMGMEPPNCPIAVEQHSGVPYPMYMDRLHSLGLDLAVAPLQDNKFNECKSNLRILEAGACDLPIIAQDLPVYRKDKPPVYGYAKTEDDWLAEIERFLSEPRMLWRRSARSLREWVGTKYTYEGNAAKPRIRERMEAWLPKGVEMWRPVSAVENKQGNEPIVCCKQGVKAVHLPRNLRYAAHTRTLKEAVARSLSSGKDVLYMRPGTTLGYESWVRMYTATMNGAAGSKGRDPHIGVTLPLMNDGLNALPFENQFTPADEVMTGHMADIVGSLYVGKRLRVHVPMGSCMLITAQALAVCGAPDVDGCEGHEEAALAEWGCRAAMRGFSIVQVGDAFAGTVTPPTPTTPQFNARVQLRNMLQQMNLQPERLTPEERENIELHLQSRHYVNIRPGAANYPMNYENWTVMRGNWRERLLDGRPVHPVKVKVWDLTEYAFSRLDAEQAHADGYDWVLFKVKNVDLHPEAEQAFRAALSRAPKALLAYADHDVRMPNMLMPFFKTQFDLERLLSQDYVSACCAINIAKFSKHVKEDFGIASRLDLFKGFLEAGLNAGDTHNAHMFIQHVPEVLATEQELEPEHRAVDTSMRHAIVEQCLLNHGIEADIHARRDLPGCLSVVRKAKEEPKITIVIPTKGDTWILLPCLNTILSMTQYKNYRIVVAFTTKAPGSPESLDEVKTILGSLYDDPRVVAVRCADLMEGGFNWSLINNKMIDVVKGSPDDYYCFLNDDTRVLDGRWLTSLMAQAVRPDVGVVGIKMLHPGDTVQHIGVVSHRGINGHPHKGMHASMPGIWNIATITHEVTAVTGACIVVRAGLFEEVGGFDEKYTHNYNDVDFCQKIRQLGLRIIADMSVQLQHAESSSRPAANSDEGSYKLYQEGIAFSDKWKEPDPYWPANLQLQLTPDRMAVYGLQYELFAWDPQPKRDATTVLVINERTDIVPHGLRMMQDGYRVMTAEISNFEFAFTSPKMVNTTAYDVRMPRKIAEVVKTFGVKEIYFCGMLPFGGRPAAGIFETLRCLELIESENGLPVHYVMDDYQSVCPRGDMLTPDGFCDYGWKKGEAHCQACIDKHGSPLGNVNVEQFRKVWSKPKVLLTTREAAE